MGTKLSGESDEMRGSTAVIMRRIAILLLFTVIAFSCDKEYYTTIPNFPVSIELRLANLDFDLNTNLAYKIFTQPRYETDRLGFGGVLVINGIGTNTINLFAYDLSCPVEAQRSVRVEPDNLSSSTSSAIPTAVTATCPKCGAVFNIANGSGRPVEGTKHSLRSYRVSGSGMQYTVIN